MISPHRQGGFYYLSWETLWGETRILPCREASRGRCDGTGRTQRRGEKGGDMTTRSIQADSENYKRQALKLSEHSELCERENHPQHAGGLRRTRDGQRREAETVTAIDTSTGKGFVVNIVFSGSSQSTQQAQWQKRYVQPKRVAWNLPLRVTAMGLRDGKPFGVE